MYSLLSTGVSSNNIKTKHRHVSSWFSPVSIANMVKIKNEQLKISEDVGSFKMISSKVGLACEKKNHLWKVVKHHQQSIASNVYS